MRDVEKGRRDAFPSPGRIERVARAVPSLRLKFHVDRRLGTRLGSPSGYTQIRKGNGSERARKRNGEGANEGEEEGATPLILSVI